MKKRILLCIGCNQYDATDIDSLNGAEADANNIFSTLTDAALGGYDPISSHLLLSPTLADIRKSLDEIIALKPVDTITIFYAGHGGVCYGSYYLFPKSTSLQRLSTTALGMPELLGIISELAPLECNIIIDACQAGGVTVDLSTIIKPEILGASSSPSISIFCSSSADRYAEDTFGGGTGTLELLKVLKGNIVVQTTDEYLDLVAVGRVVSAGLIEPDDQCPVVWGLNLSGKSEFSKNPFFLASGNNPQLMRKILRGSEANKIIQSYSDRLLSLNLMPPNEINPNDVYAILNDVSLALVAADQESAVPQFLIGYASSLAERVKLARDVFAPVYMFAACEAILISLPNEQDRLAAHSELSRLLYDELSVAYKWLVNELDDLSLCDAGIADLYLIPIRVTRILGWGALYISISEEIGKDTQQVIGRVISVVRNMINLYPLSFSAVSDEQTPFLATFLAKSLELKWHEEAEYVLGSLFSSFHLIKGNIAAPDMQSDDIAQYIFCRGRNDDYSASRKNLAHPSEFFSALLLSAHFFGVDEVIDPHLEGLDFTPFNIFIPEKYKFFSSDNIPGTNHTYQVGLGVWAVADLMEHVPDLKRAVFDDENISDKNMQIMCICASFLFPDRCPWFLLLQD